MNKKTKGILVFTAVLLLALGLMAYLAGHTVSVLEPKGVIGRQQKDLIVRSVLLMAIVVVPVYILTIFITVKYRATNKKARYEPDWDHNRALEAVWWGIPLILITVLSIVAWNSSHRLDPFRPLESDQRVLKVQVIALQWRWLFIYPEQEVASLNSAFIPLNRPVDFNITSDAPMNSFWVPQLGGQIYAMSGMNTHLYLNADTPGIYAGSSANISGKGFAGMNFQVQAGSEEEFQTWVKQARTSPDTLSLNSYNSLAQPSQDTSVKFFSNTQEGLYDRVVLKYLMPKEQLPALGEDLHSHGEGRL